MSAAERWEVCPKCSNMDGGCPFCGHGYIRSTAGLIAQLLDENKGKRGRSPSSTADVHWLAEFASAVLVAVAADAGEGEQT